MPGSIGQADEEKKDFASLAAGEPAPFPGYLSSELKFREMLSSRRKFNDTKTELQSCLDNREPEPYLDKPVWFGIGVMAGLLSAAAIAHSVVH